MLAPQLKKHAGFTLIEILITLVIIGLGVGMVSLATSDRRPNELRTVSEKFVALAELAAEQAALTGEPYGLEWLPPEFDLPWRYRWYRFRDGKWSLADEPLGEIALPEFIEVAIEMDGLNIAEEDDTQSLTDAAIDGVSEEIKPSIVFFTSGELTPFELEFSGADLFEHNQHIKADMIGRITWEEADDQKDL